MAEDGWVLYGVEEDDPSCLHSPEELLDYVNTVGFLPLFRCGIPGLSVEERTVSTHWWTGDEATDPWEWRRLLAAGGQVAYGKFFEGKAGFVSLQWLPAFLNFRRDGYDFDSLWEDEKASWRQKKIMDCFQGEREEAELYSFELKNLAGFGKGGEKGFEGTVTGLQMQGYLCLRDFRRRRNKRGEPYGWHIAVFSTPEHIFGRERIGAGYGESPAVSARRMEDFLEDIYPIAGRERIRRLLGIGEENK